MKYRNYEKKELITFIIIILFILEILVTISLYLKKEYNYEKLTAIVLKENLVMLVLSKEERNLVYQNRHLYYQNKKIKYQIIEDKGTIISKGKRRYYELLVRFNFGKKNKANDILELTFKKEKYRIIELFKMIWEGD